MTQDEINEMVKQVGFHGMFTIGVVMDIKQLEAFAKLVVAKEREACAEICDNKQYVYPYHDLGTLIRARGEA